MRVARALIHELRLFFVALQFLTRVPVPHWVGNDSAWLNECVRHFPLVGALVGGAGAAVLVLAGASWSPPVAALLALLCTVSLTGAFHEDGLADTFDALGGAASREHALSIMKDSRIGTYGATALMLVLGLRVALMAALLQTGPWLAAAALVLSHVLGRTAAVAVMAWLPYAGDVEQAKARPLAESVRPFNMVLALGWGLLAVVACAAGGIGFSTAALLLALPAALVTALAMSRWLQRRLGGYTGDTLGATEQLAELGVLLVLAIRCTS